MAARRIPRGSPALRCSRLPALLLGSLRRWGRPVPAKARTRTSEKKKQRAAAIGEEKPTPVKKGVAQLSARAGLSQIAHTSSHHTVRCRTSSVRRIPLATVAACAARASALSFSPVSLDVRGCVAARSICGRGRKRDQRCIALIQVSSPRDSFVQLRQCGAERLEIAGERDASCLLISPCPVGVRFRRRETRLCRSARSEALSAVTLARCFCIGPSIASALCGSPAAPAGTPAAAAPPLPPAPNTSDHRLGSSSSSSRRRVRALSACSDAISTSASSRSRLRAALASRRASRSRARAEASARIWGERGWRARGERRDGR